MRLKFQAGLLMLSAFPAFSATPAQAQKVAAPAKAPARKAATKPKPAVPAKPKPVVKPAPKEALAPKSTAPKTSPDLNIPIVTGQSKPVAVMDPNRTTHPRSSFHDFSDLLDAPAGKHGFLTTKGEHFYWENGQRARFWGINVANTSLQQPDSEIDAMVENFRTAGFNLVRLHHFDERGGIIDLEAKDSRQFVESRLKKLDYWIYKAKQAGMYVYLDLLDYRRFKEGDGVVNADAIGRSAKPYAVFNRKLIELQKEYAHKLLREHVNPYTGLAYADEPAVVMMEVYDENGLFMRRGLWRSMPDPYQGEFRRLWNDWLKEKYQTTGALAGAWTDGTGKCVLYEGESLEDGTVELPAMTWTPNQLTPEDRPYAEMPRRNDGARFAYEIHRRYLREMKQYLRQEVKLKIPICVTGRYDDLPDLRAQSEEMDFIGCNFYYDHPYWASNAPQWQLPSYYHNLNPLHHVDERSMAATTSLSRVKGKPFVVREWNYCWPNRNRAAGMIEAAAYASLHDFDAMILFVYEANPTARVSYFNVRSDPSRWGLTGVGAEIFLKGFVKPSQHRIVVPYNDVDTFTYTKYHQPLYALGWATRVENDFYSGNHYLADAKTSLIVPPGRSSVGQYSNAPAVLYANEMRRDLAGRTQLAPDYLNPYNLQPKTTGTIGLSYDGLLFDVNQMKERSLPLALPLGKIVASGYRPIGVNPEAGVANGFLDIRRKRLVFGSLDKYDVLNAALDAMELFHQVPNVHSNTEQSAFRTDTGEIFRDAASGRIVVNTPAFQALCGNLVGVGGLSGGLGLRNARNGTLVALALDGQPLVKSRHYVIKMVTDAKNADEVAGKDPRFLKSPRGQWKLDVYGKGPVITIGRSTAVPVQISLGGKPVADVYLEGGSWELYVNGDERQFYCDTPGTRFALYGGTTTRQGAVIAKQNAARTWQKIDAEGRLAPLSPPSKPAAVNVMAYPANAAAVLVTG